MKDGSRKDQGGTELLCGGGHAFNRFATGVRSTESAFISTVVFLFVCLSVCL